MFAISFLKSSENERKTEREKEVEKKEVRNRKKKERNQRKNLERERKTIKGRQTPFVKTFCTKLLNQDTIQMEKRKRKELKIEK